MVGMMEEVVQSYRWALIGMAGKFCNSVRGNYVTVSFMTCRSLEWWRS